MSKPYSIKSVSKSIAIHSAYYLPWYAIPLMNTYRSTTTIIAIVTTIAIVVIIADHDTPHPEQPNSNTIMALLKGQSMIMPL